MRFERAHILLSLAVVTRMTPQKIIACIQTHFVILKPDERCRDFGLAVERRLTKALPLYLDLVCFDAAAGHCIPVLLLQRNGV